jgi:hypothetical protein
MCVSIDKSTSISALNINATSLSVKSFIENEEEKKKKKKEEEEDLTLETKTIFFVILIF